jgi:CheY-like chemotaxis protein
MVTDRKGKAKVLVIDDEQIVHESIERILGPEGYEVEASFSVDDAERKLEKGNYDLALTDMMMPEKGGLEALKLISQKRPDCPVVMFTGYATVDSAVESLKLGALDYLPKPFSPEELLEVCERSLAKAGETRRSDEMDRTYEEAEKAIAASLDLRETFQEICKGVIQVFKVKGCAIYTYDVKSGELALGASAGLSDAFISKGALQAASSIPSPLVSGEPAIINEDQFDTMLQYPEATRAEGVVSVQSIPLKVADNVLGFLRVYCSDQCIYGARETEYFSKFADQAAAAIQNALSYERVKADVEELKTRLSNRGAKDYGKPQ